MQGREAIAAARVSGWPVCAADEQEAALRVLRSGKLNYWTGGEGKRFEREFAEYVGRPHAIAVANGTLALELALHALGVGPGDEVVVPARTFIATASAVVRCGATPVCADVDPVSQNVTAETVAERLTTRTRAVVVVHLAGWPCEMEPMQALATQHGLKLIEDCAQAHGARYRGRSVGSFGDAAAFSFCQDKILTTAGEGGMVTFGDEATWKKAWSYKDHGKDYDLVNRPSEQQGFRWLHRRFGSNFRMTEVQSAIGRVVLRKLDRWVDQRRHNAETLNRLLGGEWALRLTPPPGHVHHAYYKWYAFVRSEALAPGWNRDRLLTEIERLGVRCFSGSCGEIYREQAFDGVHPRGERLPVARDLAESSMMLQVDPTLDEGVMADYASAVRGALANATRERQAA